MEEAFNSGNFGMSIPETPSADTPMDGESIVTEDATAEDVPEAMPEEVAPEESPKSPQRPRQRASRSRKSRPRWLEICPTSRPRKRSPSRRRKRSPRRTRSRAPKSWLEKTWTGSRGSLQDHRGRLRGAHRRWRIRDASMKPSAGSRMPTCAATSARSRSNTRTSWTCPALPKMGEWISAAEDAEDLKRIMDSGTADEVISMLDRYKAAGQRWTTRR